MQIYGNEKLNEYKIEAEEMQEKFSKELDLINNEYTPIFARIKKKRDNNLYYTGLVICALIIILVLTFLDAFESIYLLIAYIIGFLLLTYSIVLTVKSSKNYKNVKEEWNKRYESILIYKEKVFEFLEKAKNEVLIVITKTKYHLEIEEYKLNHNDDSFLKYYQILLSKTKEEIYKQIGKNPTNEDILLYYDTWGKQITSNETYDNERFLEERRRKAILKSIDKDN